MRVVLLLVFVGNRGLACAEIYRWTRFRYSKFQMVYVHKYINGYFNVVYPSLRALPIYSSSDSNCLHFGARHNPKEYNRRKEPLPPAVLRNPDSCIFGTISYSLYLIHQPLISVANKLLLKIAGKLEATSAFLILGLSLVPIGVCAWLFYRFVEVPSMRQAKNS